MSLTREHIDKLVARFSGHKEPPAIYISEYEEFTSKLHDFSEKEQQLKEKLRLQSVDANSPENEQPPYFANSQNSTLTGSNAASTVTMNSRYDNQETEVNQGKKFPDRARSAS